jgi:hypothetical protein
MSRYNSRETQSCRDKKLGFSVFCFLVLSGKLGKQSLRFRAAKTFFFGITVFLSECKSADETTWFGDGLCTSGDHERELLPPTCHCLAPRGGWRFPT